jgi:hypothetical protein
MYSALGVERLSQTKFADQRSGPFVNFNQKAAARL